MRQMDVSLEEAKDHLAYFFTKDGSENVTVTLEGQPVSSYEELVKAAGNSCYQGRAYLDVGLFLSNEGRKSIWPKRLS
jgi:hypothetical protein